MINCTTVVTDKEKCEEIKKAAKRKPSEKARAINKRALELLRKMRE